MATYYHKMGPVRASVDYDANKLAKARTYEDVLEAVYDNRSPNARQEVAKLFWNNIAQKAKSDIQKQQLSAADEYASKIPELIGQETELARREIGEQLADQQRQLRGNMSSRGLLYSGQRLKNEAGLAGSASQNLAQRRADTIRAINQTSQDLYNRPLGSVANVMETGAQHQNAMQDIRNRYNQAMSQQSQALMGGLGEGFGRYLGNRPTTTPTTQTTQTASQNFSQPYTQPSSVYGFKYGP